MLTVLWYSCEKATRAKIHESAAIFSAGLGAAMSPAWSCSLQLTVECIHHQKELISGASHLPRSYNLCMELSSGCNASCWVCGRIMASLSLYIFIDLVESLVFLTGLCVFSSVCLYCCATTTPTSQPPAAVVICGCIYGWMCWIFADVAQIGGVSSSSSHMWPCCSLQNRPAAVQRSPNNGPPPPCMNPALTNTSWVRERRRRDGLFPDLLLLFCFYFPLLLLWIYGSCHVSLFHIFPSVSASLFK